MATAANWSVLNAARFRQRDLMATTRVRIAMKLGVSNVAWKVATQSILSCIVLDVNVPNARSVIPTKRMIAPLDITAALVLLMKVSLVARISFPLLI